MTPDANGIPAFDLDDLQMGSLNDPVTAGQLLRVINRSARTVARMALTTAHIRTATIQSVDAGPPLSLTVKWSTGDQTPVPGVRYQVGLLPVVGDLVFVLTEAGSAYVTGKVA